MNWDCSYDYSGNRSRRSSVSPMIFDSQVVSHHPPSKNKWKLKQREFVNTKLLIPMSFENSTAEDMVDSSPEAQQPYKGVKKRAMNWCSWKRAVSHPFASPTTATLYCTCRRYANVCVWRGALHPARRHRALHWTRLVPHFILWMPPPGDEGRLGKYVDANCLEWPRTKKKCVAGQSDGEWRTHGRRQNESSAFVPVNAPLASRSVHFLQSGHLSCRGRHVAPPPAANSLGGSSRCSPDRDLVWTSQDQGSDEAVHHVIQEKKVVCYL